MRRSIWLRMAEIIGLGGASLAMGALCGCSVWEKVFPPSAPTLANSVAIDRALRLCSLKEGEQPFHLVLEITPPEHASSVAGEADFRATVEVFWINPITYRTEIRSSTFKQTRIVNGRAVEEHDTGDFYPRWIENFVDALLDPVPQADRLRHVPGSVPVGLESHACIATSSDGTEAAQICFQNVEPRIASGGDAGRSVSFDDFAPFGQQQIPRTLVDDLPDGLLIRSRIAVLEPLPQADYPLLKATEFTLPEQQIATTLVSESAAESMLDPDAGRPGLRIPGKHEPPRLPEIHTSGQRIAVLVRTDRTGKVREAYLAAPGLPGQESIAITRALALRFKPFAVDGAPRQMEATVTLP